MQINTIILLVLNSLLLIALIAIHFAITTSIERTRKRDKVFSFFLFAVTLFFIMFSGIEITDGVTVDSSSLLISISILYLGPWFGLSLAGLGIVFRILFGINIDMIMIEILSVYLLAMMYRSIYSRINLSKTRNRIFYFFSFGLINSIVILISHFYMYEQADYANLILTATYVFFVFPVIMLVIGNILYSLDRFFEQTRRLRYLSKHDELTGLYNNQYFNEVSVSKEVQNQTLILCNLNGIKDINDTYGFETGNRIIVDTANTIKNLLEEKLIFRLSGNDFAIIVDCNTDFAIDKYERDILETVNARVIDGVDYTISVGSAIINKPNFYQLAENDMLKNKLLNSSGAKNNIIDTVMNVLFEKDPDTRTHANNVSYYSGLIAEQLNLPYHKIEDAKLAGMLHDIGKIITPNNVFIKMENSPMKSLTK